MTDLNKLRSEFEEAYLSVGGKQRELELEDGESRHSKAQLGWDLWQIKAKDQAVPETHKHSVTLTCAELKEAYDFGAPDESQEQMTYLVTIGWHENGHSGAGYYAYMTECEDEGSIKLGESESGAEG
jgi:hypothetical protein